MADSGLIFRGQEDLSRACLLLPDIILPKSI